MNTSQLLDALTARQADAALRPLYALDGRPESLDAARARAVRAAQGFLDTFGNLEHAALYSCPGRTEIGGNHTDHQHGRVLCGSVDLDMLACAAPNGQNVIRILSEGYPALEIDLSDLEPRPEEKNTSAALVRGVADRIQHLGYHLRGFDAWATSTVISGSGLSSSAAYEILIGTILNHLCCGGALTPIQNAQIGQYAENVYFGKPCGLMDQMGSAVGGAVAIDFQDPSAPVVEKSPFDFSQSGYTLCIVDTGSCHADLTDDYADITREMGAVAAKFNKIVLRDVVEGQFWQQIPALRQSCGDRAVLRAMHFFAENRRAALEAEALKQGDFDRFLALVNESGQSSEALLENIWSPSAPREQAVTLSLAIGRSLLGGAGAIRVHGGGFAGTIQAFVPNDLVAGFRDGMETILGKGRCHILHIRPIGGCQIFG